MENFVLSGKAHTVFKIIELAAKREEAEAEVKRLLKEDKAWHFDPEKSKGGKLDE